MRPTLFALPVAALAFACLPADGRQAPKKANPLASRHPDRRQQLLEEHGGSARSEQAVADGLRWLALHQAADGHWGLSDFNKHARKQPWPLGPVATDNSAPGTSMRNDHGATALALLPFLAAGITHRAPAKGKGKDADYHRAVGAGLNWLIARQSRLPRDRGHFGGGMYSHALATLALCEAYTMTGDARLRGPAQAGLDYIVFAQHDAGGWRYSVRQAGDLSVTGFQVRALCAGQRAGLKVSAKALQAAGRFIDSTEVKKGGEFSYLPGQPASASMTAVGLLCRQYLGANPGGLAAGEGVKRLEATPPNKGIGYYQLYYTTEVMFHLGGDRWRKWNLGPAGDGKGGVRDFLIERQDDGGGREGNKGSWEGNEQTGGRLGATSFALLTLQVYYRTPRAGE